MKIFKEIMLIVNSFAGPFCLGYAMPDLFVGDYKTASWLLFVAAISFMVGYFAETFSKD